MSKNFFVEKLEELKKQAQDIETAYSGSKGHSGARGAIKTVRALDDAVKDSYPLFSALLPVKMDRSEQYAGDKNLVAYSFMRNLTHSGYRYVSKEFLYHNCFMDFFAMDAAKKSCIEIELKVSRSDFLRDFEKMVDHEGARRNKHVLLAQGRLFVKQFYFLMPERMVAAVEIPNYCGLIYFREYGGKSQQRVVSFNLVRPAPALHKNNPPAGIWEHIADRMYSQLNSLWNKTQASNSFLTSQPAVIKL